MKKYYLIKDLATLSGLSTDTIRFYEKRKLLHPSFRGDNNYRYYDENILKRIIFIKRCRSLDLSLNEIERLIELEQNPQQSCHEVNNMIDLHIQQTTDKIKELKYFKTQLQSLRSSCNQSNQIMDCEILKRLEA
mgnify:FL=1